MQYRLISSDNGRLLKNLVTRTALRGEKLLPIPLYRFPFVLVSKTHHQVPFDTLRSPIYKSSLDWTTGEFHYLDILDTGKTNPQMNVERIGAVPNIKDCLQCLAISSSSRKHFRSKSVNTN